MEDLAKKVKVGMSEAAATMSAMLHQIDDEGECDALLQDYLKASENLQHAISRRKYLLGECKLRKEQLKTTREELTKQIAQMDRMANSITDSTTEIIVQNPDIVFRDDLGKRVYVAKNAKSTIEYTFSVDRRTLSNVISESQARALGDYASPVVVHVVDSDKVRQDLEAGISIPFAIETLGLHLRGM